MLKYRNLCKFYRFYSCFSVCDDEDCVTLSGVTEESIPQVYPDPIFDTSQDTENSLLFSWQPITIEKCQEFQAPLGYFFYTLTGVGQCQDFNTSGSLNISETMLSFENLRENCVFDFYLYVTNNLGEFDETVFMKVTKNTYNYILFTGEFISGVLLLFVISSLILMKMLFNARKRIYLFTLNQYNPLPEDAK